MCSFIYTLARIMKVILFLIAAFVMTANCHTYLTNLTINGTLLDEGKCIRPPWKNENFPVKDVISTDMRCRTAKMSTDSADICPVAAGSVITVDMHESGYGTRFISESHRGACIVYMAPLESNGEGNVWFKIYEDGWDPDTDTWCTIKVIETKGKLDVTIPADIAPGNYLLRTEIIALHEADRVYGADKDAGAEIFPNCAQLAISGTGTVTPSGVAIPGAYDKEDPGLHYDLWGDSTTYEIPGPTLYTVGSAPPIVKVNIEAVESLTSSSSTQQQQQQQSQEVVTPTTNNVCRPRPMGARRKKRRRRQRVQFNGYGHVEV